MDLTFSSEDELDNEMPFAQRVALKAGRPLPAARPASFSDSGLVLTEKKAKVGVDPIWEYWGSILPGRLPGTMCEVEKILSALRKAGDFNSEPTSLF